MSVAKVVKSITTMYALLPIKKDDLSATDRKMAL